MALRPDSVTVLPVELRYIWPSELDLMAQLAGLTANFEWRVPPDGWHLMKGLNREV